MNQIRPRSKAARARRPSPTEQFLIEKENRVEETHERAIGTDGEVQNFTHTGAALVVLYFPTSWGWESREVPSTNVRMCLGAGARIDCGDCHDNCSPDPMNPQYNNCEGRDKFATRQCQICGRLVYDFGARSVNADLLTEVNEGRMQDSDGTLIEDNSYVLATPAARTKSNLDQHILAYHPSDAASLGLGIPDPRLVNPARSVAEAQQVK